MLGREDAIGHPALTDRPTGLANRLHFELVHSYLFGAGDRGVTLTILLISIGTSEMETGTLAVCEPFERNSKRPPGPPTSRGT